MNTEQPIWGHQELMVIAAHRYCLGRRTYIVSECVKWLLAYWDGFDEHTQYLVIKETHEAIQKDNAGDPCDVREWQRLLDEKGGVILNHLALKNIYYYSESFYGLTSQKLYYILRR